MSDSIEERVDSPPERVESTPYEPVVPPPNEPAVPPPDDQAVPPTIDTGLPPGSTAGPEQVNVHFSVGLAEGGGNSIVGAAIQDQHNYFYSDGGPGGDHDAGPHKLDAQHFDVLSARKLEARQSDIVVQRQEFEELLRLSSSQRIFFLEGPPELGKGQIVLKLAAELVRKGSIRQVQRPRFSLRGNMGIDLTEMLKNEKAWGQSLILLDNAFRHSNRSLLRLAREMDAVGLEALEARLKRLETYVVLTYDSGQVPAFHSSIRVRVQKVTGPDDTQLRDFLQRRIEDVCEREGEGDLERREKLEVLRRQHDLTIVAKLKTIPRIERFLQAGLSQVLEGKISLESALEQSDQLDTWLLEQRSAEQPELVFALALTLCHAGPPGTPVRWYQFERMRQELEVFLRRELGQDETPRNAMDLCREPEILTKLQIEIVPDPEGDVIRYLDESRAERLWRCLLGAGRRLSATVIPLLIRLAGSGEFFLRRQAGWALGRMSKLERFSLFGRHFDTWAAKVDHPREIYLAALTALVQGAVVAGDPDLRTFCIERLRSFLSDPNPRRVATGSLALMGLGLIELRPALDLLRPVFLKILLPCLVRLERQEKKRQQIETVAFRLFKDHQLRSAISSLYDADLELELLADLPSVFRKDEELEVLMAAQFSLIGLSLSLGVVSVLNELRRWMPAGKAELAPLLAFVFLRGQGMAEVLERRKLTMTNKAGKPESWSPILFSAAVSDDGERDLAEFLFEIYLGASLLPRAVARVLTARWLALIERWTRQAAEGNELRDNVLELWTRLLRAPDLELRERLGDLLGHPEFGEPGTRLGELVDQIRRIRGQGKVLAG